MAELTSAEQRRCDELIAGRPLLLELGNLFDAAGQELALVGGPVRDALLGREVTDLDFATTASPEEIEAICHEWADAKWDMGREFGTIGLRKGDEQIEITTYRADSYDATSRKPTVSFGDSLHEDLARRDFTVNAMAIRLPSLEFVDLHNGLEDLADRTLRTPSGPDVSFGDDPLRMMRAVRFVAQLSFELAPEVFASIGAMSERLSIVSAERIREEFSRLLLAQNPIAGLRLLVETGIAERILPELPALALELDEHHRHKDVYEHSLTVLEQAIALEHRLEHQPDLTIRLAALLHDIGKPPTRRFQSGGTVTFHHHDVVGAKMARKRLRALKYPNNVVDDVSKLIELHLRFHGYGSGDWTDSAVRRYVRDAGEQLVRLHILTRADCTTRNTKKALRLQRTYDDLESRIDHLSQAEELQSIRPDLDGKQIMEILDIEPGPEVGQAYSFLLELRMDRGPLSPEMATEALLAWWAARN